MTARNPFRCEIEEMIEARDLHGLLRRAGELHGHHCNYLAYGVMAGVYGIRRLGVANTGMEEVVAIVETNNCFADGVQIATGCSFGNNSLIFRDYGKTAVTIGRRNGRGIRLVLDPDFEESRAERYPEAHALFDRLVARREQGTTGELARMLELFAAMSCEELETPPETAFRITEESFELPDFAPIFESVRCACCGEKVMRSRAVDLPGGSRCIPCARAGFHELNGGGIERHG